MIEQYIDFFNIYIMGNIQILLQFYFFVKFLNKKVRLPFYFLFVVYAIVIFHFISGNIIIEFGVFVFLLTVSGILVYHVNFKSALLYAALVVEIMQLCFGIINSFFSILYPLLFSAFHNMANIVFMLAGQLVSLILTGLCYYIVYRYFSFYSIIEIQYMFMVFIPILMIFIMDEYINSIVYGWEIIIEKDGTTEYEYLINHWQMFIIQLLGIASLFCILFAYKKLLQSFHLRTELSLLEQKEHSLNQYVEEAKSHYEKTKSFRHDIKNHIIVIKDLLQNRKIEQAIQYIGDMEDMAEELLFPCSTNNPVVDILVGNKLGIAKNMGIDVDCSLLLPYPCNLRDIDICIILSNALDNAIHACKNINADIEKYIHIAGRVKGDFLMIEIENSYQGKETFKKGTGLSNIKTVAEKYNGAMSTKIQEGIFVLHVLLIISQHPKNISQQID